jgi:hypothetical protein
VFVPLKVIVSHFVVLCFILPYVFLLHVVLLDVVRLNVMFPFIVKDLPVILFSIFQTP